MKVIKNHFIPIIVCIGLCLVLIYSAKIFSLSKQPIAYKKELAFDRFEYKEDTVFERLNKIENDYFNSILAGFYSDPSICRVDNDFYSVTSSFSYFPRLPLFKSTDLVHWKKFGKVETKASQTNSKQELPLCFEKTLPNTGNFMVRDDFEIDSLGFAWDFLRTPEKQFYSLEEGKLVMEQQNKSMHEVSKFSLIGRRRQHGNFDMAAKFSFSPSLITEAAGLGPFQNESHYLFRGKRFKEQGTAEVVLEQSSRDSLEVWGAKVLQVNGHDLWGKIGGRTKYYGFYYKQDRGDDWRFLKGNGNASLLSIKAAKGFVGSKLAMYASNKHFKNHFYQQRIGCIT